MKVKPMTASSSPRSAAQANSALRVLPLLGRFLIALIFVMSGIGKVASPAATKAYIASAGLPFPDLAYIVAVVVELVGGILLIIGYQTRITAIVIALYTLAAALFFHANFADSNQLIHFMKNIAIIGGLLQVAAFGAGAFSVDRRHVT